MPTFRGHTHIIVFGKVSTPERFWGVTLLTKEEFDKKTDWKIVDGFIRPLMDCDRNLVTMHFGAEGWVP